MCGMCLVDNYILWFTCHLKLSFMCLVNIYLWLTSHLNLIESQNVEHMIWSWLLYHPMYTICSLKIKKSKWFNWELNCWTQAMMFDLKAKWNKHNYGWWKKFLAKLNQRYLGINCELTCVHSLPNPQDLETLLFFW